MIPRLICHLAFLPWWAGDSGGYSFPGWAVCTGNVREYDGGRTPGYPTFLVVCELLSGGTPQQKLTPVAGEVVTWVQSLLGVASVFLLYLAMERLLIRRWICFSLALFYALLEAPAEFEMIILSDFLCVFLTLLTIYLMTLMAERLRFGRPALGIAALVGICSGATALVRPNGMDIWIVFVASLIAFSFLKAKAGSSAGMIRKSCGVCALTGAVIIGAWLAFNFENTGLLTLTPVAGMVRTNAAYNLFDRVHPEDKVAGDIMVKYYRQTNANGQVRKDYVNAAFPELLAHYKEMPVHRPEADYMAVYVGHVADYLMLENPGVWLQNGLVEFRQTADFHYPQAPPDFTSDPISLTGKSVIIDPPLWRFLVALGDADAPVILVAYLLTFVAIGVGLFRVLRAPDISVAMISLVPLALAAGAIGCLFAFCALASYFNRFSLSLLPIYLISSGYVIETGCLFWMGRAPASGRSAGG